MGVHELQILRDELEIDQPTRDVFQVPAFALALFGRDCSPHLHHIARDGFQIARPAENVADDPLDTRRKGWWSRDHAGARQRQMLPGPGLVFLIALERADHRGNRTGPPGWAEPHVE